MTYVGHGRIVVLVTDSPNFADIITAHRAGLTEFVAPVEAQRLVDGLDAAGRRSLDRWLRSHAVEMVADVLTSMDRSDRSKARRRSACRAFSDAAEAGDAEAMEVFATFYVVDAENLRRRLGEMTAADHRFVASGYAASSKRDAMLAQFHQAVARKVGKGTTADVMTEATYLGLLDSITGCTSPTGSRAKAA